MPYRRNVELPASVKESLPLGAQNIYREAYNSAWDQYAAPGKRRGGASREETAHKVAWSAVKHRYRKKGDAWTRKG